MYIKDDLLRWVRAAALPAPETPPEAAEPPVCTLFDRCNGCPYPAHGFICWVRDGDCIRQTMRRIHGIQEENCVNQSQSFE